MSPTKTTSSQLLLTFWYDMTIHPDEIWIQKFKTIYNFHPNGEKPLYFMFVEMFVLK